MRCVLLPGMVVLGLLSAGCKKGEPEPQTQPQLVITKSAAPSFAVKVEPGIVPLLQGGKSKLTITIARKGYDGAIKLEARNLPTGVSASSVSVPAKQSAIEMELVADKNALPVEQNDVTIAGSAPNVKQVFSPYFSVNVGAASFALRVEPTEVSLRRGASGQLKVTVVRQGYDGPIDLEVGNLPANVRATKAAIPAGQQSAEIAVTAGDKAKEGAVATINVLGHGGEKIHSASPDLTLRILGGAFALEVRPAQLKLAHGESSKLSVVATRRGYDGPVMLEVKNLPAQVKAKKALLGRGQTSVDIELFAGPAAASIDNTAIHVVGTATEASGGQAISAKLALTIEGRPFDLFMPARLDLPQGSKTKLKIVAKRLGYAGPIKVELRDLPRHLSARPITIAEGAVEGVIEITATEEAGVGDHKGKIIATTTLVERQVIVPLNVQVLGPFTLRAQPEVVTLTEGGKAKLKLSAERHSYDGPIALELRGLPAAFSASKATIAAGQKEVEIELTAAAKSTPVEAQVQIAGIMQSKRELLSGAFTVSLGQKPFELKAVPAAAKLMLGETTTVKVVATRSKTYQGPIALELRRAGAKPDLPNDLKAAKITLAQGQSEAEIEIVAGTNAAPGKIDLVVQGTAVKAGNQTLASSAFALTLVPGFFELRTDPLFELNAGSVTKLKVTALRKGYKGPIAVEVRNLPKDVAATKSVIPAGKDQVELELKPDSRVPDGDKVDVYVRGSAMDKQVYSPNFTLMSGSVGERGLELKVEPAQIKVGHRESVKVKVTATRKSYDGAIKVELRNLPDEVEAAPATIPAGQTSVELILTAGSGAALGTRPDICAVGIATSAENRPYASPHVTVTVVKK